MEAGIAVLEVMGTRVFLSRAGKLLRCGDRQLSECAIALRLQELRWLEQEDDYRLRESVFGEQKKLVKIGVVRFSRLLSAYCELRALLCAAY